MWPSIAEPKVSAAMAANISVPYAIDGSLRFACVRTPSTVRDDSSRRTRDTWPRRNIDCANRMAMRVMLGRSPLAIGRRDSWMR